MFGSKLYNAVVSLSPGSEVDVPPLGNDQIESIAYPSVDPWLAPQAPSSANGQVGGPADRSSQTTDCLTLVGSASDIYRQQLVRQIVDTQAGLPVVVLAKQPALGEAVGIMKQGAFAVVGSDEPAGALAAAVTAAATEGRQALPKRQHALALRLRLAELTSPERQVLDAMLDGMANKQIAQALQIGLRTVELRRSKIMRKMGARSLAELVKFVCLVLPALTSEPPKSLDATLTPTG